MTVTSAQRRLLLKMGLAVTVTPVLSACKMRTDQASILSGCDDHAGQHYLAGVSASGALVFKIPVAQRVHDIVYLEHTNQAVFVARRPGTHLYVVGLGAKRLVATINSPIDRHFYGHGVVSKDKQWLYVTENDFNNDRGIIGVYRIGKTLIKEGELAAHGIGPHQLTLDSTGNTLIVANGGLLTRPATGRKILNLATMAPNLSYISLTTGELVDQVVPPNHQMSIRHLDIAANDWVIAGVQYQGQLTDSVPSVLIHKRGESARWMTFPETLQLTIKHYIASVAVDDKANVAVVSCPRGNRFVVCDLNESTVTQEIPSHDAAGLRFQKNHWVGSNGEGELMNMGAGPELIAVTDKHHVPLRWDNHLTVI